MGQNTPNEDLASSVGQESTTKDFTEAYDKKAGKYSPPAEVAPKLQGQPPSSVSPFGNVK